MEFLTCTKEEQVAFIAINRPPANALGSAVIDELSELLDQLEADRDIRVLLLHGDGRFFQLVRILKNSQLSVQMMNLVD